MMTTTPRWLTAVLRAAQDEMPPLPYARGHRIPAAFRALPTDPDLGLERRAG